MHNLSMTQALEIWFDLTSAYYGRNSFGGDTAEIYMYRLMSKDPVADSAELQNSEIHARAIDERIRKANASLASILELFSETYEADIYIFDQKLGPWLRAAGHAHRVHVRVEWRGAQ